MHNDQPGNGQNQTPTLSFIVEDIFVGCPKPFTLYTSEGAKEIKSAFMKQKHDGGPLLLTSDGLVGDGRESPTHAGPARAIYFYPTDNYQSLAKLLPDIKSKFVPGAMGENVSLSGFTEKDVCIGDIFEIGSATIQITQPRRPCMKLNHRFVIENMSITVQKQGLTGWMCSVLKEGEIQKGAQVKLVKRVFPHIKVSDVLRIYSDLNMTDQDIQNVINCDVLDNRWKEAGKLRISKQSIPVEEARLYGASNKFITSCAEAFVAGREYIPQQQEQQQQQQQGQQQLLEQKQSSEQKQNHGDESNSARKNFFIFAGSVALVVVMLIATKKR